VKWKNKKGDIKTGFYMDGYLMKNIEGIPDFLRKEWDVVAITSGHGKVGCLTGDTLIKTNEGDKHIKELSNQTILVESINLQDGKNIQGKAKVFSTGIKEVFEIETIDGRKVKATKDHTFFINKNNKIVEIELRDLKEGDDLICE